MRTAGNDAPETRLHPTGVAPAAGPKHGYKYDPRLAERAAQDPVAHGFPAWFDDAILGTKPIPLPGGANGYALRGWHNGKEVVYNMIVKDGVITHRDFVNVKNWPQRNKSFKFNTELDSIPCEVK